MLVSDPIFSIRTANGTHSGGLFDLLGCVADGTLIDLPAMQPHQRGPGVTALAIILTALSRYAPAPLATATGWEAAWRAQLGGVRCAWLHRRQGRVLPTGNSWRRPG